MRNIYRGDMLAKQRFSSISKEASHFLFRKEENLMQKEHPKNITQGFEKKTKKISGWFER